MIEARKEIARRLVTDNPAFLTLDRLDDLIEQIEQEVYYREHIAHLDCMDELRRGDSWLDDSWPL